MVVWGDPVRLRWLWIKVLKVMVGVSLSFILLSFFLSKVKTTM